MLNEDSKNTPQNLIHNTMGNGTDNGEAQSETNQQPNTTSQTETASHSDINPQSEENGFVPHIIGCGLSDEEHQKLEQLAANSSNLNATSASSTSGFAITSLILGIVTWVLGWLMLGIPGILGIIFGALGISQCKKEGKAGNGMAIAGLVLSIVMIVCLYILLILAIARGTASFSFSL